MYIPVIMIFGVTKKIVIARFARARPEASPLLRSESDLSASRKLHCAIPAVPLKRQSSSYTNNEVS